MLVNKNSINDKKTFYNQYREKLMTAYLEDKTINTFLQSKFSMFDNKCLHKLEISQNGQIETIESVMFDNDDDFLKIMFEPSIIDFAQCNKVLSNDTFPNGNNVNMQTLSETNNVLTLENISYDMANTLINIMKKTEPILLTEKFNKLEEMEELEKRSNGVGKVLTLTNFNNPNNSNRGVLNYKNIVYIIIFLIIVIVMIILLNYK